MAMTRRPASVLVDREVGAVTQDERLLDDPEGGAVEVDVAATKSLQLAQPQPRSRRGAPQAMSGPTASARA